MTKPLNAESLETQVTEPLRGHPAPPLTDEDDGQTYSIRDLCDAFGITPRALRFYEDQGLISPERDGQRRIYSTRDRVRVQLILRGKRFGFSLAEVRELLDLYDLGDGQVTQFRETLKKAYEKLDVLRKRQIEIAEAIEELEQRIADGEVLLSQREKNIDNGGTSTTSA